jgi:hypothetical protein
VQALTLVFFSSESKHECMITVYIQVVSQILSLRFSKREWLPKCALKMSNFSLESIRIRSPPSNMQFHHASKYELGLHGNKLKENVRRWECFLGDFNARVPDYIRKIHFDDSNLHTLSDVNILHELKIPCRRTCQDLVKNNYGNHLFNMCKSNNLYLLNGTFDNGQYTTIRFSIVDFIICSVELSNYIRGFFCQNFGKFYPIFISHCQ